MKVKLLKNIKYKGDSYKIGESIEINKDDIKEFINKKVIDENKIVEIKEIDSDEENDLSNSATKEDNDDTNTIAYDNLTKGDIVDILTEKGIEHNARDKKENLYDLLIGSE